MQPGMTLPDVALPSTDGRDIDLGALPGKVLLIVYPWTGQPGAPNPPNWDDIPGAHGSTPELEAFRDLAVQFAARGIALLALSRQATGYQQELVTRLGLPFPILSDVEDRVWPALRLETFETGGETYLTRVTLLIENGAVARVFDKIRDPGAHAAELLAKLEA